MMSEKHWWLLTMGWFLAVGIGWAAYFWHSESVGLVQINSARWIGTVQAMSRMKRPTTTGDLLVSKDRLMADVGALSFPRSSRESRKKARAYIAHALTDMGYRPELNAFSHGINLIARSEGSNPKEPVFVLGAHYDTVAHSPGADDNATGVAAVLEIARLLKKHLHTHSIVLAFWDGEEKGLLGSRAYLASKARRQHIAGAIILEMIGYMCTKPGCQKTAPGIPSSMVSDTGDFITIIGDITNSDLLLEFAQVAVPRPLKSIILPVFDGGWPIPQTRRSDHASFWDNGIGAVMVTDTANFRNPHYHTQSDTPETLSADFLAGTTEYVWRTVSRLISVSAIQ